MYIAEHYFLFSHTGMSGSAEDGKQLSSFVNMQTFAQIVWLPFKLHISDLSKACWLFHIILKINGKQKHVLFSCSKDWIQ